MEDERERAGVPFVLQDTHPAVDESSLVVGSVCASATQPRLRNNTRTPDLLSSDGWFTASNVNKADSLPVCSLMKYSQKNLFILVSMIIIVCDSDFLQIST